MVAVVQPDGNAGVVTLSKFCANDWTEFVVSPPKGSKVKFTVPKSIRAVPEVAARPRDLNRSCPSAVNVNGLTDDATAGSGHHAIGLNVAGRREHSGIRLESLRSDRWWRWCLSFAV